MGKALRIGGERSAEALRREARREKDGRAAARMYAIAHALEGLSRAEAARLAGMERQALRDAVVRLTTPRGSPGFTTGRRGAHGGGSRPRRRRRSWPPSSAGRTPTRTGARAWTRADLCRWLEAECGKTYHPSSMTRVLRRLGFSRQKARPFHPKRDAKAQAAFKKGGSPNR